MRSLMLLAAGSALLALSACTTEPALPNTPAQLLANVRTDALKVCAVATPFLSSMTAMKSQLSTDAQADLAVASDKVGDSCKKIDGTTSAISIASIVNDGVPALIKVIDASSLDKNAKTAAELSLTGAQVALSLALAQYMPVAEVPEGSALLVLPAEPASVPAAASTPLAGAPLQ